MAFTDYVVIPKRNMTYGNITGSQIGEYGIHIGFDSATKDYAFLGYAQISPFIKGAYYKSGSAFKFLVCSTVGFYDYERTLLGLGSEKSGSSWSSVAYNTATQDETTELYNATVGGNVAEAYLNPAIPIYDTKDLALAAMNDDIWTESDIPKNYRVLNKIDTVTEEDFSELIEKGNIIGTWGLGAFACAAITGATEAVKYAFYADEEETNVWHLVTASRETHTITIGDDEPREVPALYTVSASLIGENEWWLFGARQADLDATTGLYYTDGPTYDGADVPPADLVPRFDTMAEALAAMNNGYWPQPVENRITNDMISPIDPQTYTGEAIEPVVEVMDGDTVLVIDTDYEVSYAKNIEGGTGTVYVAGIGTYAGIASAGFTIEGGGPGPAPKKKKGRKNLMVGGYCLVEGVGINLQAAAPKAVTGIYEAVKNAIDTNKPIIIYDTVTGSETESVLTPIGCACETDADTGTITVHTYIGIVFTIGADDVVTIVTE